MQMWHLAEESSRGVNVCALQNSYTEILTPNMIVFGGEEVIGLDEVMRVEPL